MSESIDKDKIILSLTICNDCIFHVSMVGAIECANPDEFGVNCDNVTFCNSFQPMHEVESPCVAYGQDMEI